MKQKRGGYATFFFVINFDLIVHNIFTKFVSLLQYHMNKAFLILIFGLLSISNGFSQFILWDASPGYHVIFAGSGPSGAPDNTDGTRDFLLTGAGCNIIADGTVNNMTLYTGSSLTITGSSTLTINGNAIINSGATINVNSGATLIIASNINNIGSISVSTGGNLIQTHSGGSSVSGTGFSVRVQGNGTSTQYNLWSSPVSSTNLTSTFSSSNPCDMFVLEAGTQLWGWDIVGSHTCDGTSYDFTGQNISGADGIMDVGRGYTVSGGGTTTFSGTVNDGDISIGVSATGATNPDWAGTDWNLLGNPYPSSISASTFLTTNSGVISGTIYFWDDDNSGGGGYNGSDDYATWNLAGGSGSPSSGGGSGVTPNGSIASGQGFFVQATSSGTVSFTNAMRGGSNNQFFKMDNQEAIQRYWIRSTSPENERNQILVAFTDQATDTLDWGYDSKKFVVSDQFIFGSLVGEDPDPFVIQSLPKSSLTFEKEVPLSLYSKTGGVSSMELLDTENTDSNVVVYIKDYQTGKLQNLNTGLFAVYLNPGQLYDTRFSLVFMNEAPPVGIEQIKNSDLQVYHSNGILYINSFSNTSFNQVSVISSNGTMVFNKSIQQTQHSEMDLSTLSSGFYIVKMHTSSGIKTSKFVIK